MISAKKNLWLLPNQICMIRGSAVALNLMFENKKDHKVFLQLWDKYLGKMTEVHNYHLTPTDWTILFKTKSAEEITDAYLTLRQKSKKAKSESTLTDPKKMLSEHIRIFLSQFVRDSNRRHRRKGTKVLERFHKYILKSSADYEKLFQIITNQIRIPTQINPKYRADERKYDTKQEMGMDDILKVGNRLYSGVLDIGGRVLGCMGLMHPTNPVLRKFFTSTKSNTSPLNSS